MSQTLEFYLARANEAAADATNATLDNVRDRALRSEAAWRDMADRQTRVETQRAVTQQAKLEQVEPQ